MEKNVNIERDVTVGNNATIGGRVTVQGRVTLKHNVRVDGWLDAPNIKGAAKGLFADEDALRSKYPSPEDGWWAIVGNTLPGEIFVAEGGKWVDTGNKGGEPTVDSDYLDSSVEKLQGQVEDLQETDTALQTGITNEAKTRADADTALQTGIDNETDARKEADTALEKQLDSLIYPTIALGDLDTLAELPDTRHSRYVVMYDTYKKVCGILDVLGDGWGHVATQVLTTHNEFADGSLNSSSHTDGSVHQYYRSYNVASPNLTNEKGTWTEWKPVNDAYLGDLASELQDAIANSVPQLLDGVLSSVGELPATTDELYYVHDGSETEHIYRTYGKAGKGLAVLAMSERTLYVVKGDESLNRWTQADGLVQIAGDLLHTSDKGVAGGVAPLDGNTKIPTRYIPDTFTDVVMLRGLYASAPKAAILSNEPARYYNTTENKLYVIGTEDGSGNAMKYVWEEEALSEDRLYCDVATNSLYRWMPALAIGGSDTGKLVAISVNADEEEKRVEAEKARAEAEAARVAAETARAKAEATREASEADRQEAETARVKAERSRTVAEGDRAEHEAARQTAESKREGDFEVIKTTFTATEAEAQEAITATKNVNATLDGNTFRVTDRNGTTKELDIEALVTSEEQVTVQVVSNVASVSASGVTLSVYINHGSAATKYTTDADGKATFSVPMGSYYEINFPDFATARPISPVGYTATIPTRTITATYDAYEEEEEQCYVEVKKHVGTTASAFEGVQVTIKIGDGAATTYTTDSNGQVAFTAMAGKTVTVTLEDLKGSGWYAHNGKLTRTFRVYAGGHTEHAVYYQFRNGVFVVSADGSEYLLDEWTAAGKTSSDAVLLKVATENLFTNDAVVMLDPLQLSTRDFPNKQWCTQNVQFPSIANGQTYKGQDHTQLMLEDAEELGYESPAAEYATSLTKTVGGQTLTGYIGASNQWVVLWANRAAVDDILAALYGSSTKLLSDYTTEKWTSDQFSATFARYFTSQVHNGNFKTTAYPVVPFYAY